jgi:hypothetical protein
MRQEGLTAADFKEEVKKKTKRSLIDDLTDLEGGNSFSSAAEKRKEIFECD